MSPKLGITLSIIISFVLVISSAFKRPAATENKAYAELYYKSISELDAAFKALERVVEQSNPSDAAGRKAILTELYTCRKQLKKSDFWTRYLEGNAYRSLNGPLPVEWETEVFEKYEKPYRREGFGLTILENALNSNVTDKDILKGIILPSISILNIFRADSITKNLDKYDHFFLCNRLFLLNLADIYTTGFECPDSNNVIPELKAMLEDAGNIYNTYNNSFTQYPLPEKYLNIYDALKNFIVSQPSNNKQFDHYTFIRDYVNPLFILNQQYIRNYKVISNNLNDYTLNNNATSIFDKNLYSGQNPLGIYSGVTDPELIASIKETGKMLFYDPILSENNERSCASCHKPTECFTDTSVNAPLNFDRVNTLPRNTPSLVNVTHNHLLMLDGKHFSMQRQASGVMTSHNEMGSSEKEIVEKVLSCKEYKQAFNAYKKHTYKNKEVTFNHIISAITAYLGNFNDFVSPFDESMNMKKEISPDIKKGFNLFMGKALCATCHFIPEFNGVRPPYVESEFEVIGVPADTQFVSLDADSGRGGIFYSDEMFHAFRTNTIRNSGYTKPYMHNGVFTTMKKVVDFYNEGGGKGKGLEVQNQTLSSDKLKLTEIEIKQLLAFITSLDEYIPPQISPVHLPVSKNKELNNRKIGGVY